MTGRQYKLFDYDREADRVVVAMGSSTSTVRRRSTT